MYWLADDGTAVRENALTDGMEPIVPLKDWVCVAPALSFACTVKLYAPAAPGFPVML